MQPPYFGYAMTHAARFGLRPAGFGERLAAYVLDGLALSLLLAPVALIGVALAVVRWETEPAICTSVETGRRYACTQPTAATFGWIFGTVLVFLLVSTAAAIFYWGKLEGERTQTWGKRVMNIRTLRASTGAPIGFGRAVGRLFARYLSGQLCSLGYLWMLWDDNKQTWHDKIVDSIVVKA